MEDILAVYERPYDPRFPVICMDESCKQLVGEFREPLRAAPGHPERIDHEYVRNGVGDIFLEVEPLTGQRHVGISQRRTKKDWAHWIQGLLEKRYPQATTVVLVVDNLNTHGLGSLYETFPAEHARRLAERLELHYTPKHGSWLNMAEIELSALSNQCLNRRIPSLETLSQHVAAWETDRNNRSPKIQWQFTAQDARVKLRHLYPKL